ncbi:transketolase family protein [Streptacidiphilus melanogenes]|uniref:transketolase family protein n=1 Tax=Streptacidiphilus melanogenes TaxID=411235 RepID=UPI0005A5FA78|nr:transketolase C-terminal domain-containing protein [Streptacidiphilus melanogenes]
MRERFVEVTTDLLDRDERLALVTADLSAKLFDRARSRHPDRVLNLGIREQLLIGVAGGLSLAGLRPIAHSFAPFLVERPFEQIKLDLNHQGAGAVLVSAGASYDIAGGGRSHQAPGDVALLSTLPDWTVHVPGHPDEAEQQLRTAAAAADGLVYLRLSNQGNARAHGLVGGAATGRLRVLREGGAATVVAVGPLADTVLEATAGLDVTVLYAATVRPFDATGLRAALDGQREAAVVLVEPYLAGTSSAEVARALVDLPHRLLALGVGHDELRNYGSPRQHAIAHGLGPAGLRLRISRFLAH